MKNVVDSSCWIELTDKNSSIAKDIKPIVNDKENLIVPTISIYEVYKKLERERNKNYALGVVDYMCYGEIVELSKELCIEAADVGKQYKLALADSIIYTVTQTHNATLWTTDRHFEGLPKVMYFERTK